MYPSLGLGISTAFQDAVELAKCLLSDGGAVDARYESVTKRLVRYERNRIPACWAMQTGSRFMHEVLAATSERPAEPARNGGFGVDFTSVFFKAWQGALWLLGDREEERAITEAENRRKTENAKAKR
jgi:2-polyprenyl-6-methoxyphenol hydroxylase-like FAD-dependent oxidoreductase